MTIRYFEEVKFGGKRSKYSVFLIIYSVEVNIVSFGSVFLPPRYYKTSFDLNSKGKTFHNIIFLSLICIKICIYFYKYRGRYADYEREKTDFSRL